MRRLSLIFSVLFLLSMSVILVHGQSTPDQLSPASNAVISSPVVSFQWNSLSDVKVYVLKVRSADRSYTWKGKSTPSIAGCADLTTCVYTPSDFSWSLKHQTAYAWKVVAKLNDGTKAKTTWRSFSTSFPVPANFSLITPANNASFNDSFSSSFTWSASANASFYKIVVKNAYGERVIKTRVETSACTTTCQFNAANLITTGGNYKWKVIARNQYGKTKAGAYTFSVITEPDVPDYANEMLRLVNSERCSRGLAPLALNDTLNTVAVAHSQDMADNNYFAHNSQDGTTPWQRMKAAGYNYTTAGENIAAGNSTAGATFIQWWNSSGHRDNILNPAFREMGIGYGYNSAANYDHYWTQVFGARSSTVLGTCP